MTNNVTGIEDLLALKSNLIDVYNVNKGNILQANDVKYGRQRILKVADKKLRSNINVNSVLDFVWEFVWYQPHDIYRKQGGGNTAEVINYLSSAINYYQELLEILPKASAKINIFMGDIYRYQSIYDKSRQCTTNAIDCYTTVMRQTPKNNVSYLKLTLIYKELDVELAMIYYLKYLLVKKPDDLLRQMFIRKDPKRNSFVSLAFATLHKTPETKSLITQMEKQLLQDLKNQSPKEFFTRHFKFTLFSLIVFMVKDAKLIEYFSSSWCRIFMELFHYSLEYLQKAKEDYTDMEYSQNLKESLEYCEVPLVSSLTFTLLEYTGPCILAFNEWLGTAANYFDDTNMSVGLRMLFQSTLINYVKLLNQLPRSLSAMMKGTGPASSNLMWISEGEKLNEVLAITLNSLQNCLTDPSCPISLEASLFSYQWPKKEQLKSFTPNSSPSAPSVKQPKRVCLISKDALLNFASSILDLMESSKLICIVDQATIDYLSSRRNVRTLRFDLGHIDKLVESGRVIVLPENTQNPFVQAKLIASNLGMDQRLFVVLDPAEALSMDLLEDVSLIPATELPSALSSRANNHWT